MTTSSKRVQFAGANDDLLAARYERPSGEPIAHALFAHCFTCSKDLKAVRRISRSLVERGIALLRFDFTGLGESEGEFADTNFSSNVADLVAAADHLRREYQAPRILIGHSLGGAAALAMAHNVPEVQAVATIGAPSDTQHLRDMLVRSAPALETQEQADVPLAGRTITLKRQLLDDLAAQNVLDCVAKLNKALMVFHSPVDTVVSVDHARKIYKAARHPKSFVSLDEADHLLLSDERDAALVGDVLGAWATRQLGLEDWLHAGHSGRPTAHGEVLVTAGASGFVSQVTAGSHLLPADEPESVGGTDTGPSPYEYLLAGLGACKVMTLRMYADRKGWPLEGSSVRLRHGRIHAEDCADCETKEGRIDRIEVQLEVQGPLTQEQRERLLEIADRCPVHRTLTNEIKIQTE